MAPTCIPARECPSCPYLTDEWAPRPALNAVRDEAEQFALKTTPGGSSIFWVWLYECTYTTRWGVGGFRFGKDTNSLTQMQLCSTTVGQVYEEAYSHLRIFICRCKLSVTGDGPPFRHFLRGRFCCKSLFSVFFDYFSSTQHREIMPPRGQVHDLNER